MPSLAALLVTVAVAPTGVWTGSTSLAPEVSMTLQGGKVVEATAWTNDFSCELGGNIGPASVSVRPSARIGSGGRIAFTAGRKSRKMSARLRYSKGKITGRIRVSGTIGGPCSSPVIPVVLRKR